MTAIASLGLPTPRLARPAALTSAGPATRRGQVEQVGPIAHGRIQAVLVGLVVGAVLVAAAFLATSPPLTASGAPATAGTHVAAEGESMWSIARAHAPAGEAAGYVERLAEANGSAKVRPGQVLVLPVP